MNTHESSDRGHIAVIENYIDEVVKEIQWVISEKVVVQPGRLG